MASITMKVVETGGLPQGQWVSRAILNDFTFLRKRQRGRENN